MRHEVGAYVLADCYQSAATIPLALKEWNVDFACGGGVKWACGGPGAAYLYVRPDLLPLMKPIDTGWFGRRTVCVRHGRDALRQRHVAHGWRHARDPLSILRSPDGNRRRPFANRCARKILRQTTIAHSSPKSAAFRSTPRTKTRSAAERFASTPEAPTKSQKSSTSDASSATGAPAGIRASPTSTQPTKRFRASSTKGPHPVNYGAIERSRTCRRRLPALPQTTRW
ncbi:MAG: aminotransferase class V-fold PLP-dependent enzyme [Sandaracinaceae bacterium]|nr:aminotransferase class V-fold PLP-dependent enzyme [Sandaracinaceae bacterium]